MVRMVRMARMVRMVRMVRMARMLRMSRMVRMPRMPRICLVRHAPSTRSLECERQLGEHDDKVLSVHLEGWLAASGSAAGDVQLWDLRASTAVSRSCRVHAGGTSGVAVTCDGRYLVSCALDGSIAATDLRGGRTMMLRDDGAPLHCVSAVSGAGFLCGGDSGDGQLMGRSAVTYRYIPLPAGAARTPNAS